MAEIDSIFSDLGGVVLTNGWDRAARHRACQKFLLDPEEFEDRHELMMHAWEVGRATLEDYLNRTVFYRPRPFTRDDFQAFLFAQSEPLPDTLEFMRRLAATRKYLLAALNNESAELNQFRIERFRLHDTFAIFLSSCFLGVRKPEEAIYRLALRITQRTPAQCVFIDDRAINLECAQALGMRPILYRSPPQLQDELQRLGVSVDSQ